MRVSSARRPSRSPWPLLAVVVAVLLAASACGGSDQPAKAAPSASPTPLARLNTTSMQVPRIEFCSLVPGSAVEDAVGGKPAAKDAWGNGDEQALPGVGTDVLHELGCSWTGATSSAGPATTARAWVFARPVEAAYARSVVAANRGVRGCRTAQGAAYGAPTTTQVCSLPGAAGRTQRVRHAGLFGQTWLTCELQGPPAADLRARADTWCVQVANALDTAR